MFKDKLLKLIRDSGIQLKESETSFAYILHKKDEKSGKYKMFQIDYALFNSYLVPSGKKKREKNYCLECGKFEGYTLIDIMREPTEQEIEEQSKEAEIRSARAINSTKGCLFSKSCFEV